MAASATFALNTGVWLRRGRLVMVAPVRGHTGRHQAQNPLIPLSSFPEPPLIRDYRLQKSGPSDQEGTRQHEGSDGSPPNGTAEVRGTGGLTIKQMALASPLAAHDLGWATERCSSAGRCQSGSKTNRN